MAKVSAALASVADTARSDGNLLYPMREALRVDTTLGEISDALREVFGVYQP
jgi:methylmalonyl-CoA mutase N-terminal domain/subunit